MFEPAPLPWPSDSLVGFLTANQNDHHYFDHYLGYIKQLNEKVPDSSDLITLIKDRLDHIQEIAAQAYNHQFFWSILTPNSNLNRRGKAYETIVRQYGSMDAFKAQFEERVKKHFASGWVWLVYDPTDGILMISDGQNAYCPLVDGLIPLLCIDVWEHAYIRDYDQHKEDYCRNMWKYINWDAIDVILHANVYPAPFGTNSQPALI